MIDYSKLKDFELEAIANNDYSKLSNKTLQLLANEPEKSALDKFFEPLEGISIKDWSEKSLLAPMLQTMKAVTPFGMLRPDLAAQDLKRGTENLTGQGKQMAQGAYQVATNPVESAQKAYTAVTENPAGVAGEIVKGAIYDPEMLIGSGLGNVAERGLTSAGRAVGSTAAGIGDVVTGAIGTATPQSFAQDTANRRSQTQMVPGLNARDDLMMRSVSPAQSAAQAQMPQPDSVINNQVAAFEARQQPQALNLPDDPFQSYIKLQESPKDLINFAYDETLPENLRSRAKERASEILIQEREMARAKNQIPAMSETDIAHALREKTTGGSYIKAVLFGMLGMEQSAMAEAAKLGVGKETLSTINGEPAMIKMAANGTPIEGYNAKTGKRLSAQELITAAQFGTMQKGANIGGQVYRDAVTN